MQGLCEDWEGSGAPCELPQPLLTSWPFCFAYWSLCSQICIPYLLQSFKVTRICYLQVLRGKIIRKYFICCNLKIINTVIWKRSDCQRLGNEWCVTHISKRDSVVNLTNMR